MPAAKMLRLALGEGALAKLYMNSAGESGTLVDIAPPLDEMRFKAHAAKSVAIEFIVLLGRVYRLYKASWQL